jgi:acyl transferase domain-containing protein/acyl carrier protein
MSNFLKTDKIEQFSTSQRMLHALDEAVKKLETAERTKTEPIAIVGTSCRFPGGADTPEAFWQLLINGVDAITEVPSNRWNINDFYDPNPETPGKMYARYGGFLHQVDQFDPQFFGISPREAVKIDPQQRLLLEVSWEALENAGMVPTEQTAKQTGVFVGITTNDYARLISPEGDLNQIDAYYLTGNPLNAVAGRLSYTLGLQGPCMAVDTACSSSLVAVHLACQSLRNGECDRALAGGVNLILSPENTVALSKAKMLSFDGRCKTFDGQADGIVRGEGCGILVLKRLSDAIADGDNILALIRGSAVNQDGASGGFTVPNKTAQETLLRQALSRAKIKPSEVDYIEAHGTGTPLGDPIEVRALAAVFAEGRTSENPLKIGSVKTNIGHLESAAGIAGLIKVILSLQHQQIPPHLHLKQLNPYINWDELHVSVTTEAASWTIGKKQRIAGVSSFGASGTNAHVILEEAPKIEAKQELLKRPLHLLTLSAKSETALGELVKRYQSFLAEHPESDLANICFTANTGREHFKHRLAVLADSTSQLADSLTNFLQGQQIREVVSGLAQSTIPKIAFLFTGQGSQYGGMGLQLYKTQPIFKKAIDDCEQILRPYLQIPLSEILYYQAQSKINETIYTQPALFAIEYALYQLWKSWGIQPSLVMGHSVGEYVAACVAGVFSLEDGLKLIAARGRLMQSLPQDGGMVAVMATVAVVEKEIEPYQNQVSIAAVNGENSLVISGEKQALEQICQNLEAIGVKTKPLQVSHAFHSPLMQPMLAEFAALANQINYSIPKIKLISNLTGLVAGEEIATAAYWCNHITNAVQFARSMDLAQGYEVFVEIGPKPILLGMGRQCLNQNQRLWLPSLRPNQDDWQVMLESLAQLYLKGSAIDWRCFDAPYHHQRQQLPTYPFERHRYWVDVSKKLSIQNLSIPSWKVGKNGTQYITDCANLKSQNQYHPLLGQRLQLAATEEIHFESQINKFSPVFLQDHRIYRETILPATAYLEMALSAGGKVFKNQNVLLEEVSIQKALVLSEEPKTLQIVLIPSERENRIRVYSFQIFSLSLNEDDEVTWTLHASGKLRKGDTEKNLIKLEEPFSASYPDAEEISVQNYYQNLRDRGFDYGEYFQGIARIWKQAETTWGEIRLPAALVEEGADYQLHPVLLDACFQVLGTSFPNSDKQDVYLPVGVEQLQLYRRPGNCLWSQVTKIEFQDANQQHLKADLCLFDEGGHAVAKITGLSFRRVTHKAFERTIRKVLQPNSQKDTNNWLYQVTWKQQELAPLINNEKGEKSSWLIFADNDGIGLQLAELLKQQGDRCIIVSHGNVYKQLQADCYQVNFSLPEDFRCLLHDAFGHHHPPCRGIVHLWSIDETLTSEVAEAQVVNCGSVLHLVQAISDAKLPSSPRLYLVTKGSQAVSQEQTQLQLHQATLWGLGKVVALEHPELQCTRLDLDPFNPQNNIGTLTLELLAQDREDQIVYRQEIRYVSRLARILSTPEIPTNEPFQIKISEYGVFENLNKAPMVRRSPQVGEVEIEVRAVGINFRDVLNALGMLKDYTEQMGINNASALPFGGECSGIIVAVGDNVSGLKVGDEVIAAQTIGSLASFVTVKSEFVVLKPHNISFEAAATIPTTFLTAYYGLYRQANLQAGERILIHAAAGGVGQAAVQLAQLVGAEIFATASSSKWDFLKSAGIQQVMNSRTLDFAQQVMEITSGRGVDIVLNSLNGEYIPKSLNLLSKSGRFVEIGKIGIWDDKQFEAVRPDVAYFPFDMLDISLENPNLIASMLGELMLMFEQGSLKPLPAQVFSIDNVANAFKYMAQAKHIGKVVVTIPENNIDENRKTVRDNSSYLITGGLGALGIKIAQWLADQGARHLVLTGRRGSLEAVQQQVSQLEQAGVQVAVIQADVSNQEDTSRLLTTIKESMPPLKGIVHAAGVLEDRMLVGQSWESFSRVMAPKVAGSWNLHIMTKTLTLDFFVCFSSISALLGSPGQGNYAAANAFMDALAHHRQALGLPGLSINWGPWSETGMAAALGDRLNRWDTQGIAPINTEKGLEIFGKILQQQIPQVGVLDIEWSKFWSQFPHNINHPFLSEFTTIREPNNTSIQSELRQKIAAAKPCDRPILLMNHVRLQIAKVLDLKNPAEIDPQQGFSELGMDSLMAVEFRNRLQTTLNCSVPISVAFDYPTVETLVSYLVDLFEDKETHREEANTASISKLDKTLVLSELKELSDSEVETLLMDKLDSLKY